MERSNQQKVSLYEAKVRASSIGAKDVGVMGMMLHFAEHRSRVEGFLDLQGLRSPRRTGSNGIEVRGSDSSPSRSAYPTSKREAVVADHRRLTIWSLSKDTLAARLWLRREFSTGRAGYVRLMLTRTGVALFDMSSSGAVSSKGESWPFVTCTGYVHRRLARPMNCFSSTALVRTSTSDSSRRSSL